MNYRLITAQEEAIRAFEMFKDEFAHGASIYREHTVGYQGGNQNRDVYWRHDLGIWGLFEPRAAKGRFWICFGTDNPAKSPGLPITVEINPPISGVNRRCAGAFLENESGEFHIGHTGKVGGGRKGVGKSAFREFASSREWQSVPVSSGDPIEVVVLSSLESQKLGGNIKSFVQEVAEFKRLHAGGATRRPSPKTGSQSGDRAQNKSIAKSGKYLPLHEYLSDLDMGEWQATFANIERVLGFTLPKSAYSYPAWWSNGSGMPHSAMWLDAGFQTCDLNLTRKTIHFVRATTTGDKQRNKTGPANAQRDKPEFDGAIPRDRERLNPLESAKHWPKSELGIRYNWVELGELKLDENSKLEFPRLDARPGIYRFSLEQDGQAAIYIGESDNLPRRFGHYRNPGPSQATNIRINKIFVETLRDGVEIRIDVIVDTAWILGDQAERLADLSVKAARMLFENAAIIQSRSNEVRMLNR